MKDTLQMCEKATDFLEKYVKDWLRLERITKLVREKIEKSKKILNRRLIHAFPHLKLLKRARQKNTKRKNR